jgi:hypothetical protein
LFVIGIDESVAAMKWLLSLLFLVAPPVFAATIPESVAGMVYHESSTGYAGGGLGGLKEFTILLRDDGTCAYLKSTSASFVMIDGANNLDAPLPDTTYTYSKLTYTTAALTIGGTMIDLTLATSSSGQVSYTKNSATFTGSFHFTAADRIATAPASNMSVRGNVSRGHPLIAGFVVPGAHATDVLIRVIGPSLAQFGVTDAWADPDFVVYRGSARASLGAHHANWSADTSATTSLQQMFASTGAFDLPLDSKDAVAVIRLGPGAYTIVSQLANGDAGGEALGEVYMLP